MSRRRARPSSATNRCTRSPGRDDFDAALSDRLHRAGIDARQIRDRVLGRVFHRHASQAFDERGRGRAPALRGPRTGSCPRAACRACSARWRARARAAIRCAGPGSTSAASSSCRRRSVRPASARSGCCRGNRRGASRRDRPRRAPPARRRCRVPWSPVYVRSRGRGPPAGTPLMLGRPRGRAERQYDRASQGRPPPSAGESN